MSLRTRPPPRREQREEPAIDIISPIGSTAANSTSGPVRDTAKLVDAGRLAALNDLGLTRDSDPGMERYATRVRDLLMVPVSLVSLVQSDRQVFPGMCGLPDPWATRRSTPLSHSFCQHVVTSGEPLIIRDARLDPLVATNLAVPELNVVAYAGMPLTDDHGHVLGSLCAIQSTPRDWTTADLDLLRDVAMDCSNELRLRLARLDAERERSRRDAIDAQLQLSLIRSHSLLSIAEALNTCRTIADVRRELSGYVDPGTGLEAITLHLEGDADPARLQTFDRMLAGRAVTITHDIDTINDLLDPATRSEHLARGVRTVALARLHTSDTALGIIELLWTLSHDQDARQSGVAAAISTYTSQALERAILIENRISVAHQLQGAMLAPLPTNTGLDVAACYLSADAEETVGGDWYDLFLTPDHGSSTGAPSVLASIGDITGHDIAAATIMGQVRAMLRQTAWDDPNASPSAHLAALEHACHAFGVPATGSAVLARLTPLPDSTAWQLTWVNAGHPPPIVVEADGAARLMTQHDLLFGYPELSHRARQDHVTTLAPGTTIVLYTDGLIDGPALDPVARTHALTALVRDHLAAGPAAIVQAIESTFAEPHDDVVVLAIRIPAATLAS